MNVLKMDKKIQILNALVEGNSIRSTERMTGCHRDTILKLLVEVGNKCQEISDSHIKGFHSRLIQVDEIWTFVGKKEKRLTESEKNTDLLGDQYCFVSMDAESKLIPNYEVGKRNLETTLKFISNLKDKLKNNGRIQLTSDGFKPYLDAIEMFFGGNIDFAQLIKVYSPDKAGRGRYSPPKVSGVLSKILSGKPSEKNISTSYVERQNLTIRMQMRRFTRLTNAFSKKIENLKAALALHFTHYNFMRVHSSLQVTPCMAVGITDSIWSWKDLLD